MRIKSYFAPTVLEAMAQAREELGEDAVLLSSRRAPVESRHLGEYEVVFGLIGGESAAEPAASEPAPAPEPVSEPDAVAEAMRRLEQQMSEIRQLVNVRPQEPAAPPASVRSLPSPGMRMLLASGMRRELAEPLGRKIDARQNLLGADRALAETLANNLPIDSSIRPGRAVVLAGPAGSGRTTLLVKLAVAEGLARRRAVRFISTDIDRVAAGEPLRSYAALLGARHQMMPLDRLTGELDSITSDELVLVDTPARCRLPEDSRLDIHLVLPATMQAEDLENLIEATGESRPRTFLISRFDETIFPGVALACAIGRSHPVSYVSCGPEIPADLAPASAELFAKRILKRRRTQAISAA